MTGETSPLTSSIPSMPTPRTRLLWRQGKWALLFIALISVGGVALLSTLVIWPAGAQRVSSAPPKNHVTPITAPLSSDSAISRENAKPGTTAWQLDAGAHFQAIQGYAGAASALPGDVVPLYISTMQPVDYALFAYRLGWYDGNGARLYAVQSGLHGRAQGYWMMKTGLVACPTCRSDPATHLLEPHWAKSTDLAIGADWPSGVYLIKLVTTTGGESYIPLVVREATPHAAALVNVPVNTYQAYNLWGDYSVYGHVDKVKFADKAVKISFDRPYDRGAGAAELLSWDVLSIRWLERNGLDASYTTDVDLDAHPETLSQHRIFVDLGHDEYWSRAMRDGVETARDRGVSMAFLGANDDYWQMRFEPNSAGKPRRTFVCYKVLSADSKKDPTLKLTNDPLYKTHPALTTTQWADDVLHQPAEELIGLRYQGYFTNGNNYFPPWHVTAADTDPLLEGTGLTTDSAIAHGLVGYEVDGIGSRALNSVPFNGPANLVILATSPILSQSRATLLARTAYYRSASGAFIFDAGTIWWGWGLDSLTVPGASSSNVLKGSPAISRLTANVITTMLNDTPVAPGDN